MKVLALTRYGRKGASSRVRTLQYVPALNSYGIYLEVSPLLDDEYLERLYTGRRIDWTNVLRGYFTRVLRLLTAKRFDLLWIEKELFPRLPPWFEQSLSKRGIRYVVDYDDATFHLYDGTLDRSKCLTERKIERIMHASALVVSGNSYIADRARIAGARRVAIVPTVVDLERYRVPNRQPTEPVVVGWIGSPVTVKYLEQIVSALSRVATEFPIVLRVVGARFFAPGLDIQCRPWSEETEVREIQEFDVGIMPLPDSPWERGKCGYKLIQYMACGVPVVASPVGVNQEIVSHGSNGYLASTDAEWSSAIRNMCANTLARRTMGMRGRVAVEQTYSLQATVGRIAELLRETVNDR